MEYISQLNNFFELSEDFGLEANDQLFYLHLLNMFNRSYWQEELRCTDAVLMRKVKIGSTRTIAKVKNRLMQTGFIEFHKGKNNITVYSLTELLCHKCKAECKARCKAKCKVCCKVEGKAPLIKFTPNIANQKDLTPEEGEDARAHAPAAPVYGISGKLRQCWIQNAGMNPFGEVEKNISVLEKEHGTEIVIVATRIAKMSGDGSISARFVEYEVGQIVKGNIKYEVDTNDLLHGKLSYEYTNRRQNWKGEMRNDRDNPKSRLFNDYNRAFGFDDED